MVVGPGDGGGLLVIVAATLLTGVGVLGVEVMGHADLGQTGERTAKILMVTRGEDATPSASERLDARAFRAKQPIADVDGKQPQLVERRTCEIFEHAIAATRV